MSLLCKGGDHLSPVVNMQYMYSFENLHLISRALCTLTTHIVMMTTEGTTKFEDCMTHWTAIHVVLLGISHADTRQQNYCNNTFMPRDQK